jgi:hypothetical protein
MTAGIDRRRVLLAAAAAVVAGGFASAAAAQDARSGAAQGAARDWLALTDRLEGAASWDAASARFRAALTAASWNALLKRVRGPLGALDTRAVDSTRFATALPGFPDGDYAVIVFRTSFAKKSAAYETVTLEREGNAWRVVGYVIA